MSWLPSFFALLAGVAAAFGFEPFNLWPLTLLAIAGLAALVETAPTPLRAAWRGWLFGVGHFAFGLTWIAKAFTFQAKMPPALGWVAVFGLSLYLALFVALAAGLARRVRARGVAGAAVLAATWMVGEWLRGWVLTGFAWNPLGAAWLPVPGMAQLAAVVGALGLSGVMILAGGALARLLTPGGAANGRRLAAVVVLAITGAGELGWTWGRGATPPDGVPLVIVQPDIGEDIRYVADAQAAHLRTYLAMTARALRGGGARRPALVVWPEGAVLEPIEVDPPLRAQIVSALRPGDLLLMGGTGLVGDASGRVTAYANSLFILDATGLVRGRYDKAHLVPLGEYVPARPLMERIGLARLVPGDYDFAAGPGPQTLALPGFPAVGAAICYEAIFAAGVVDAAHRPAWLVNVSNDAWFGASGPVQHLAQARLRAIEQGLPVVRATPTGVSAVIDAHGRLRASLPLGRAGVITAPLPGPLRPTLYARFGDALPLGLAAALLVAGGALGRRRKGI